jgi:multicomponent Na+:H+ antiporter subunit E
MKYLIALLAMLSALWWSLSGMTQPLLLLLGLGSVLASAALARRMRLIGAEAQPLQLAWLLPGFWLKLLREIVVSNLQVVAAIAAPARHLRPQMLEISSRQHSELGQVILANSITLTPGTVTVALAGATLTVHALTEQSAAGVRAGEIDAMIPQPITGGGR